MSTLSFLSPVYLPVPFRVVWRMSVLPFFVSVIVCEECGVLSGWSRDTEEASYIFEL